MEVELFATSNQTQTQQKQTKQLYDKQYKQLQTQQFTLLKQLHTTQLQQQLVAKAHQHPKPRDLLTKPQTITLYELTNTERNNIRCERRKTALVVATTTKLASTTTKPQNAHPKATANTPAAATQAAAMDTPPGHTLVSPGAYRQALLGFLPFPTTPDILNPPELVPATSPNLPLHLPSPTLPTPTLLTSHKRKPPSPTNNTNNTPPNKTTKTKRNTQCNKDLQHLTNNNNNNNTTNAALRKIEWDLMEQHAQQTLTKLNKHKKHNSQQLRGQSSKTEQQLHCSTDRFQTPQNSSDGSDGAWSEDEDDYD